VDFFAEIVEFLIGAALLIIVGKAILETTLGVLSIAYGLSMFVVAAALHSFAWILDASSACGKSLKTFNKPFFGKRLKLLSEVQNSE
jgi:hypothetical protein